MRAERFSEWQLERFPRTAGTPNGPTSTQWVLIVVGMIFALLFLVFLFIFFSFIRLWIQALLTRADISILNLIGMKLRNVDYGMIVRQKIALVQENRAKLVAAEAEVPLAIAEAFRSGNLGIGDYYNLKNLQADTDMRSAIAGSGNNAAGAGGYRRESNGG